MAVTVTPSLSDVYAQMRAFLRALVVPTGTEVIRGQSNRTPQPKGDHVLMQDVALTKLTTNIESYTADTLTIRAETQMRMQLDFYGLPAGEQALAASTLLRSSTAVVSLQPVCTPLHADDAFQSPLVTAEQQYLQRWTLEVFLQWNPIVTLPQQSADTLSAILVNVDVEFPP